MDDKTRDKISKGVINWQENLKKNDPAGWLRYRQKLSDGTKRRYQNKEENRKKYLMETPFDEMGPDSRRDRILLDQNGCCSKCKNSTWMGVTLTLEIDHKNGDHQDNRRENLEALCPNCRSITPTWRGKNKRSCTRVSDDEVLQALKSEPSIRQALIKCNLSPRGGNYKRFARLQETLMVL